MHGANIKHKIIICFIVVPPLVGKIGKKPLFHVDIVYIGNAGSRTTFITCGGTFYTGGLSKCPPRYGGTNHTTIAVFIFFQGVYLQDFLSPENNVPIEFNKNKKYKNPTRCGIILFRPGICPCWLRCPVMGRPVIHMRRTFVNLEYWGRPSRRPPRKSPPN